MSPNPVVEPAVLAREIYGVHFPSLSRYVDILRSTGVEWGLLGPHEADRLWDRHILNCAALNELIAADRTVADVGSGAGLPGVPLALLRPDLQLTLLEPLLRRSTFLTQTVEELGIEARVQVIRSRAEDHHQTYDVVVARALAPLDRLIGWCNPLRSPSGIILALKGSSAANEILAADTELRATHLNAEVVKARAHPAAEPATVVRLSSGD
ncbi:MAG TPA: 16S rRNA (guanine(527)-N(7))-methyltransferase RsmG [Propionibacteriaceae bacterium]|nr:16S rRNA (guanine(527)-N(7))-methyltransferase RsmG [Propionibacteriaceae bacterium]